MGILDRAAQRFGYVRQDAAPAASPAQTPDQRRIVERHRADDWNSILGSYANRPSYGAYSSTLYAAEELYGTDGLAAAIVDRPAEDAIARGFDIEGDEKEDVVNEMDRLDAGPALTEALRWSRLTGGAAILPFLEDGLPLDAPLDLGRIRTVTQLMVYPSSVISMRQERYSDPALPNYGWPTHYDVRPRYGSTFAVHESRLLTVGGDPLPYAAAQNARLPWLGRGVLEGCYADLCRYREALRIAKELLALKQQPVHAMSGLGEMLTAGLDDVVAKRLETADFARNIRTIVAIDAEDKFLVHDTSVGGIDSLLKEYKAALCSSSGVDRQTLFGESPDGLNASGEGLHENYHRVLRNGQQQVTHALERLVSLIYAQRALRASEPPHWRIVWRPLWSPTDKELADTAKAEAEAKRTAIEAIGALVKGGLATPDEGRALVREQVFETLPTTALPEEDDTEPQAEVEGARKTGVEAIVGLLDASLVTPEEARDLARRIVPDLPEGLPPEPEPEPVPTLHPTDPNEAQPGDPETEPVEAE